MFYFLLVALIFVTTNPKTTKLSQNVYGKKETRFSWFVFIDFSPPFALLLDFHSSDLPWYLACFQDGV